MIFKRSSYLWLLIIVVTAVSVVSTVPAESQNLPFHGFVETSVGGRYDTPSYIEDDLTLSETRAQLEFWDAIGPSAEFQFKTDIINDDKKDEAEINLREAYISAYPAHSFEVKAGRQVLTWGTGDLLFINDLFPKDYKSFFIGRDQEYLKAPSDAVKFSFYPQGAIVDVVWTPVFEADRYVDGERLTYFDFQNGVNIELPTQQTFSGEEPDKDWNDSELALRVKKNYRGHELAFYGYRGHYKQPSITGEFARLNAYGGSWRSRALGGITNFEFGYYDSVDDSNGDEFGIPNSSVQAMVGYDRDLGNDLSIGLQYKVEHMQDYDEYKNSSSFSEYLKEENRDVATMRITKQMNMQTVKLDMFTFYSPSDEDGYLRPKVSYDWTDNVNLTVGGNIFFGDQKHTEFAQMEDNSNIYFRMRYSY